MYHSSESKIFFSAKFLKRTRIQPAAKLNQGYADAFAKKKQSLFRLVKAQTSHRKILKNGTFKGQTARQGEENGRRSHLGVEVLHGDAGGRGHGEYEGSASQRRKDCV